MKFLWSFLLFLFLVNTRAHAIPTGTGGHEFPLGSDAGDDFVVDTDKLVVEGDDGDVGIGTSSPTSLLHIEGSLGVNVTTITGNTTLNDTHNVVLCNNSSDITVTLPASASNGDKTYYIKKIGNNANTVTIDGNAAETIDGATTLLLYVRYDAVRIVNDGSNWHVISDELRPHVAKMTRDAAQSINTSTITKIAFDNEDFDVGSIADSATNDRFDIRRAGKYLITVYWRASSIDVDETAFVYLYHNGTSVKFSSLSSGGLNESLTPMVTETLDLAASDTLEMYVFHSEGASINTDTANEAKPFMTVMEIRP